MARDRTTAAEAPAACATRQKIICWALVAVAAACGADRENHQAGGDRRVATIAVSDRPPDELTQAETDQETRNGPFHRARPGLQGARHGGHRRKIEVGRKRGESHERAKDGNDAQPGGPRAEQRSIFENQRPQRLPYH
jgi:hypothetical protein